MWITAEDLECWAARPEARSAFPELVRRLIAHGGARLRRLVVPSGSGTDLPGWDGEVEAEVGNAWLPEGRSRWELSCREDVQGKAGSDLEKRTRETSPEERSRTTFVFATSRKWSGKAKWLEEAKGRGWRDVRAFDAHDLVQWLEAAPAVALRLAEKLGKAGPGVETVDRFFARWSKACSPPITARALATGRFRAARQLRRLLNDQKSPITLRADSEEEAAAFAALVLQRNPSLAARTAVVTAASGWRWVEQNPDLRFVLCASAELAEGAPVEKGIPILVPHARGQSDLSEAGEKSPPAGPEVHLPRPSAMQFEKALSKLGIEEPRARALADRCGRSWAAFRRLHATSPALRTPPWTERPEARALSTLALLGAWDERVRADREVVARLAGRSYEEVERDLRTLADQPDPPVLQVGGAWKAKAIAELFLLVGPRLASAELARFFEVARDVLTGPPGYGSSSVLARFVADSLIRLAVLGPGNVAAASWIDGRVAAFVRELFEEADAERWRRLAPHLPALAEAAPDAFLEAVERALRQDPSPIVPLFSGSETSTAFSTAGSLLGALELLARDPLHLLRVAEIFCRLGARVPARETAIDPLHALLDLFRPWYPQTNATLEERLQAMETLAERFPDAAFDLFLRILTGPIVASERARPAWRDAWQLRVKVTSAEGRRAVEWTADRAIALAEGNPERLARSAEALHRFRAVDRDATVLQALERFARTNPPDAARLSLHAALCKCMYFDELVRNKPFPLRQSALPLARLWRALAPRDPVLRHAWLFFRERFLHRLPGACDSRLGEQGFNRRERIWSRRAIAAVRDVHRTSGVPGLLRLAAELAPFWVGKALEKAELGIGFEPFLAGWLGSECRPAAFETWGAPMLRGWLEEAHDAGRLEAALEELLEAARNQRFDAATIGRLLALAPFLPSVWDRAAREGPEAERAYWSRAAPWPDGLAARERERAMRGLIDVGRAADALKSLVAPNDPLPSPLLLEALTNLPVAARGDVTVDDCTAYNVSLAVARLEADPAIDRGRLAELEFVFLSVLQEIDLRKLVSLWNRLASDPDWFVDLVGPRAKPGPADYNAFVALSHCPCVPGQRDDGTVDGAALTAFVDRVLERTRGTELDWHASRALARLLVRAPADPDGRWPCEPVAALLDREDLQMVREAFPAEYLNAQDFREIGAAAREDREKAERFTISARAWSNRYPRAAALLHALARVSMGQSVSWANDVKRQTEGLY